jgi:hypothetical protein
VIVPVTLEDDSPRGQTLDELLAFPEPVQRLARLAELRQVPGGGGDRQGSRTTSPSDTAIPCSQ